MGLLFYRELADRQDQVFTMSLHQYFHKCRFQYHSVFCNNQIIVTKFLVSLIIFISKLFQNVDERAI
jgi:hypothetical protein